MEQQRTHAATKDTVGEHDQIPVLVHQLQHVVSSGEVEQLHRKAASADASGRVPSAVLDERVQLVSGHHGSAKRGGQQARQRQPAAELQHALTGEQVAPGIHPPREVTAAAPHVATGVSALACAVPQREAQLVATVGEGEDGRRV